MCVFPQWSDLQEKVDAPSFLIIDNNKIPVIETRWMLLFHPSLDPEDTQPSQHWAWGHVRFSTATPWLYRYRWNGSSLKMNFAFLSKWGFMLLTNFILTLAAWAKVNTIDLIELLLPLQGRNSAWEEGFCVTFVIWTWRVERVVSEIQMCVTGENLLESY